MKIIYLLLPTLEHCVQLNKHYGSRLNINTLKLALTRKDTMCLPVTCMPVHFCSYLEIVYV